jgi:hypothetical protein
MSTTAPTAAGLDLAAVSERYFAAWAAATRTRSSPCTPTTPCSGSTPAREAARGKEAVRAAFAEIFERFPGFDFDVHRVLLGEGHWVLDWTLISRDGERELRLDCIDAVVVSAEGLVERKDTFIDAVQLQAALTEAA